MGKLYAVYMGKIVYNVYVYRYIWDISRLRGIWPLTWIRPSNMRLNKCGKMVFYIIMNENFGSEDRTTTVSELNTGKT